LIGEVTISQTVMKPDSLCVVSLCCHTHRGCKGAANPGP
jgi:hypothetical protein